MPRKGRTIWLFILLSILLFSLRAIASTTEEEKPVPEIKAMRTNPDRPIIDGNLNDPVWKNAALDFAHDFTQVEPDEGHPATESTLVAVVYDDDAVYFAFWNFDSEPDKIARQLVRRDRQAESDWVSVRLDPYHDHQTGYRFELSAAGVQRDLRLFDDVNQDPAWDGVWESAVRIQSWGWSAEIRIPYHCLRFPEKDEHIWGMNVTRYISSKNEFVLWAFSPSTEGGHVSRFGHLTGISGIKPAGHFEILPYIVSSVETEPKHEGNPDGKDFFNNTGFDVKYCLSSNLTINATINPDFGQVELDEPVLNLSSYETWYPEKRPFFLEGANLFDTQFMLFYSRRIGRPPLGLEDDRNVNYYTDYPASTSILGAAKLTGKLKSGTSIGILNALTAEEKAEYVDTSGVARREIVEPLANYSVFRVKQDVFSNSYIGGMFTMAGRDSRHPAHTGGIDWRLFTDNSVWGANGQVVFSRVDEEEVGFGFTGEIRKDAGKHIRGAVGGTIKDPHLEVNHLGFISRNDIRHVWSWVQYRTQDDWWIIRNSWNNFNLYAGWNYNGDNIEKGGNFNFCIEFINNWQLGGGVNINADKYDDRETRDNGLWERPQSPSYSWWANLNTDLRKKVSFDLNPGSGNGREGSWWANYIGMEYRPQSNIELSAGVNFVRDFGETRWVENNGGSAIFASLDKNQINPDISASIMFHRNLSLQLSAEAIMAGLDYRNARCYMGGNQYDTFGPGAIDPEGELYEDKYDRNCSMINSTLIMRWEYLPGSTLYLVWTRSRMENDRTVNNLDFNRDFDRLFSGGGDNVFLIKASYWWNI